MDRQTPVSNPQATFPQVASDTSGPELGRWLTRDLRPKGAPLSGPPAAASAPPSEADVLAGWLARDLTPKNSARPRAPSVAPRGALPSVPPPPIAPFALAREAWDSVPPFVASPAIASSVPTLSSAETPSAEMLSTDISSEAMSPEVPPSARAVPAALRPRATALVEAAVATSFASTAVDSLAPQAVPPARTSLPVVAPGALDDDDLAVLPGRRRAAGSERKKYAFVLLGALCFAAAIVIGVQQRGASDADGGASVASPTDTAAVLPPPPPSAEDLDAVLEEPADAPAVQRAGSSGDQPDDALDPLDPRNVLGGPSVRRYADVPSPTLSRLAREQRRLARERDDAARQPKSNIPR